MVGEHLGLSRSSSHTPRCMSDLRLTLDRTVTLVDERSQQLDRPGQWCLADDQVGRAGSKVVPFNMFEVKLAGDDPMPPGLQQAENDRIIQMAAKFSKFLTGAAAFNKVTILPYWAAHPSFHSFFQLDNVPLPTQQQVDYQEYDSVSYNLMEPAPASVVLPNGVAIAPKNPARVEPKTYFANERAFIQWISASLLLLSVSSLLLEVEYDNSASVISFSSLILVVYSFQVYNSRFKLLKSRQSSGYFNKVSPRLMSVVVGLAVILVWADTVWGRDLLEFFVHDSRRALFSTTQLGPMGRSLRSVDDGNCSFHTQQKRWSLPAGRSPSALVPGEQDNSYLVVANDSLIYLSPDEDAEPRTLLRLPRTDLKGLSYVNDRIFAVSSGPARTELIEFEWLSSEKLSVVARWTLMDVATVVNGFTFTESLTAGEGSFWIGIDSSIQVFSVPQDYSSTPRKLRRLNMKVVHQGATTFNLPLISSIAYFESALYILKSSNIEIWNPADGSLQAELTIPAGNWKGLAVGRRSLGNEVSRQESRADGPLEEKLIHVLEDSPSGNMVWTFPMEEDGLSVNKVALLC